MPEELLHHDSAVKANAPTQHDVTRHDVTRHDVTRRGVVRAAAAAGLAVPFLVACGSNEETTGGNGAGGGGGETPGGGNGSGGGAADGTFATADVPVGGGKIFADEKVVVTQPSKGEFMAFSAVCTHQGCTVAEIAGGQIKCPCHGSVYSIEDGSVVAGPAPKPLPSKTVEVQGDQLSVS
jgi:nitrite reductase/ring-hydroxylating ferredoxin subunit